MRLIASPVLFIVILILLQGINPYEATAQTATQTLSVATLQGAVIDSLTGNPLSEVHVFLSGSRHGAITDFSGRYRIRNIPPGVYRLIVSRIGYKREIKEIVIRPGTTPRFTIPMQPVVYKMGEIFAGDLGERWERYLERFHELFIGTSKMADSTRILNPEVLRFSRNWWGRFTAEALAPLKIENYALGYHITYVLEEFYHSGTITRWDGNPHFTEMTPATQEQAERWERNRSTAFYGSLRHFLIGLADETVSNEGFLIYEQPQRSMGYRSTMPRRIQPDRLITEQDNGFLYTVRFPGRIEIIYTEAGEDYRYIEWARNMGQAPARNQTSYLELNRRSITMDGDGEIRETYGATRFGYFSYKRVADQTPRDYRPATYRKQVEALATEGE
ncbi:MAG: carboxypeptidase-like regulatory domain-containing protein, partial [Balneolaceae bacterium]